MVGNFNKQMSDKRTITLDWNIPISMVISIVGLAIYGTMLFNKIDRKLDAGVTERQVSTWIQDAREANPTVKWPRLPERQQSSGKSEPVAYFRRID
jgi:hypothetical protein